MNISNKNGPEEADNSPNENTTGIVSPSNDSFQQSLYIAAMAVSLDLVGFVSPVTDDRNGIHYDFDFYHSESGTLIKVLQFPDEHGWRKYRNHPSEPIIIIDGHSAGFELKKCPCCEKEFLNADHDFGEVIHEYSDGYVFYEEMLWDSVHHEIFGKVWNMVTPYAIRVIMNRDDVFEEDEENESEE